MKTLVLWFAVALSAAPGCTGDTQPGNGPLEDGAPAGETVDGQSTEAVADLVDDGQSFELSGDSIGVPDGTPPEPDLCAGCQCDDSCGSDDSLALEVEDAGPVCGNGNCEPGETFESCPADCNDSPDPCGNGVCDAFEDCDGCPEDCGDCCGNGTCDEGESWLTCLTDCPNPCGDGSCGPNEECDTCPADCGACPGAAFCNLSGKAGDEISCAVELAAAGPSSSKAVGLQFKFSFDAGVVEFVKFHDELCTEPGNCMPWDIPPQAIVMPTGHNLAYTTLADGLIKVILYHGSDPTKTLSDAWLSQGQVQGDPWLFDIVVKLKQDVTPGASQITVDELVATDAEANSLAVEMDGNLFVTQ